MAASLRLSIALSGGALLLVVLCLYGIYGPVEVSVADQAVPSANEDDNGQSSGLRRLPFKHQSGQTAQVEQVQGENQNKNKGPGLAEHTAREIEQASGKALQALLRSFWQLCSAKNNCNQQLAQLHGLLSPQRLSLLENFAALEQARDQLFGAELISQDTGLEDKIARVKAVNEQVWGQDADLLYRDEYARYDYALDGRELSQSNGVSEFIDGYRQLNKSWQGELANLELQSPEARYEQALSLMPASFSDMQRARAREELAQLYLTPKQAASVKQRQQQVAEQARTVAGYQQGLAALKRELAQQRKTSLAHLSPAQWQSYQSQRRYQYRLDYFRH